MNEERKRELGQLLDEAMGSLVIRPFSQNSYTHLTINVDPPINAYLPVNVNLPVDVYRKHFRQHYASYSEAPWNWILQDFRPEIQSEPTKSKFFEFLREELATSLRDDEIASASYAIEYGSSDECYLFNLQYSLLDLYSLLQHLLTVTVAQGIEGAVLAFDRHIKGTLSSFQSVAALEGIRIEAEIPVFDGVRLVPRPHSTTFDLLSYLPYLSHHHSLRKAERTVGSTLLIIDRPVFSILHRPSAEPFREGLQKDGVAFLADAKLKRFPNNDAVRCFTDVFCQALSIACNSAVQVARTWSFLAKDEFFDPNGGGSVGSYPGPFGNSTEAKESQIQDAKHLYDILVNPNLNVGNKLRIPIDRWIRSKVSTNRVDRIIDLGIALESLYLSDLDDSNALSFQLGLRAAWHLGNNKQKRSELQKEFREIYDWRSKVVHTGRLPKKKKGKKKIPFTESEAAKFIARAQELCRKAILKTMDAGKVPSWKDLILGD